MLKTGIESYIIRTKDRWPAINCNHSFIIIHIHMFSRCWCSLGRWKYVRMYDVLYLCCLSLMHEFVQHSVIFCVDSTHHVPLCKWQVQGVQCQIVLKLKSDCATIQSSIDFCRTHVLLTRLQKLQGQRVVMSTGTFARFHSVFHSVFLTLPRC